jgi:hypothetical protein
MVKANEMTDRGTNALKTHLSGCEKLEMRQTRRGKMHVAMALLRKSQYNGSLGPTRRRIILMIIFVSSNRMAAGMSWV